MARSDQFGGGWSGDYGRPIPLSSFDILPWEIRRLYCYAAYDYTPAAAFNAYVAGQDVGLIVRAVHARMQQALRREVVRLYGAGHPQARA